MSGPGSSSLPPRPTAADPVTRISRAQPLRDQNSSPQGPAQQTPAPGHGEGRQPPPGGEQGHHDPAVSLAASFGRLDRGTVLAGLLVGLSPEGEPLLQSPNGTYVIEIANSADAGARSLRALLVTARDASLEIIATERVIEARVLTLDGKRPQIAGIAMAPTDAHALMPVVKLTLIEPAEGGPLHSPPPGTVPQPATSYAPSPTFQPRPATAPAAEAVNQYPLPLTPAADEGAAPARPLGPDPGSAAEIMPKIATMAPTGPKNQNPSPLPPSVPPATRATEAQPSAPVRLTSPLLTVPPAMTPIPTAATTPPAADLLAAALPLNRALPALLAPQPLPGAAQTGHPPALQPAILMLHGLATPGSPPAPVASPLPQAILLVGEVLPEPTPRTAEAPPAAASALSPTSPHRPEPAAPGTRLHTPAGIVTLAETLPLPAGSQVRLSLAPIQHSAPLAGLGGLTELDAAFTATAGPLLRLLPQDATTATATGLPRPQGAWPEIETMITTLVALDPALAGAILARLPSPDRLMTPVTLLFLTALGLRNPGRLLLGPDVWSRLDRDGKASLLSQLDAEISRPLRAAQEQTGDWRSFLLPLRTEDGVQAIPLVVRHSGGQDDPARKDGQNDADDPQNSRVTRFLLDLRLKTTGQLQFDGIIRDRNFNLILRSERHLDEAAGSHIRGLFQTALEISGYKGEIQIRTEAPLAAPSGTGGGAPGSRVTV